MIDVTAKIGDHMFSKVQFSETPNFADFALVYIRTVWRKANCANACILCIHILSFLDYKLSLGGNAAVLPISLNPPWAFDGLYRGFIFNIFEMRLIEFCFKNWTCR